MKKQEETGINYKKQEVIRRNRRKKILRKSLRKRKRSISNQE